MLAPLAPLLSRETGVAASSSRSAGVSSTGGAAGPRGSNPGSNSSTTSASAPSGCAPGTGRSERSRPGDAQSSVPFARAFSTSRRQLPIRAVSRSCVGPSTVSRTPPGRSTGAATASSGRTTGPRPKAAFHDCAISHLVRRSPCTGPSGSAAGPSGSAAGPSGSASGPAPSGSAAGPSGSASGPASSGSAFSPAPSGSGARSPCRCGQPLNHTSRNTSPGTGSFASETQVRTPPMWSPSMCVTTSRSNTRWSSGRARNRSARARPVSSLPMSMIAWWGAPSSPVQRSQIASPSRAGRNWTSRRGAPGLIAQG